MQGFQKGATIKLLNGDIIVVVDTIGSGGTADTYRVLNTTKNMILLIPLLFGVKITVYQHITRIQNPLYTLWNC